MDRNYDADVIIVGAGPVGLAVAVELGLRGIRAHVIEAAAEIGHWWTRAMNMNKRTMEHVRRWGVAGRLKEINHVPPGWPSNVTFVDRLGGYQIGSVHAEGLGWHRTLPDAAEDALWVAQGQVQQVLLERAQQLGATVSFNTRALGIQSHDESGVTLVIDEPGKTGVRTLGSRFLVGCDGGRSIVRRTVDIPYLGPGPLTRQVSIFFRAPALLDDMHRRGIVDSAFYMCTKEGQAGTARLIAGDRWEFTFRPPEGFEECNLDPHEVIRGLIGDHIDYRLEQTYPFNYFELVAQRFNQGRVLIAGDAAHMIPPLGGHNLNLGFGDAVNMGWKLAHVLRGWAGEGILDSYSVERRPVVLRTAATSHDNFERFRTSFARLAEAAGIPGNDHIARSRREAIGAAVAEDLQVQWQSDGLVLDIRYGGSPIVAEERIDAPPLELARYHAFAAPGHRAPMLRDASGVPLYDRLGPEYTLLDLSGLPDQGTRAARELADMGVPVMHLQVADDKARALYGSDFVLIRPDQHVAWRGNPTQWDVAALVRRLTCRTPASFSKPTGLQVAQC
jgi:2-polyprenyl-6-methoxyphenol hydroxylase-like FAD-dependent oxidoreductase